MARQFKVLLVDDEPDILGLLGLALRVQGADLNSIQDRGTQTVINRAAADNLRVCGIGVSEENIVRILRVARSFLRVLLLDHLSLKNRREVDGDRHKWRGLRVTIIEKFLQ